MSPRTRRHLLVGVEDPPEQDDADVTASTKTYQIVTIRNHYTVFTLLTLPDEWQARVMQHFHETGA